ncbi:phosphoesterase [Aequorivita sp. H23M31]|uniref:Phosphoesterase n=1 Tax=Aequorivita ciconiae TaxID=2494375 RepID=A0A410G1W2_9FLAO|nr:phosphoesterase [Aequorivita sp. H23M31]QAA81268.1 phosphoesterase [Aequorivita sp. H23M31]
MNRINIFITFVASVSLLACASYNPKYKNSPSQTEGKSISKDIAKTFYFIGNAGNGSDKASNSMQSLSNYLAENNSEDSYVVFLGNSFYPKGMQPKKDELTKKATNSMQSQLSALKDFKGKILVVPGNMEWQGGVDGLELEEDFLKDKFDGEGVLQPNNGCPLEGIDVSEDIYLLLVDTQWFLEDWDNYPEMNRKCEIKTRDKFFTEIESELKKNANKTIIFTMYHPLLTYGQHGGKYPLIHKDVFSTLIKPIKSLGAISKQDRYNERYNELIDRVRVLTKDLERLVFVSGLDQSLQYIENGNVKQIVSGSGSGSTAATLGQYGKFSYGGEGFARLDIDKNSATEVRFFKSEKDGNSQLLYQHEIFSPSKDYDFNTLHNNFPKTVKAKIYEDSLVEKTGFYKTIWGEHYRNVYGTEVTAKTVLLDTLYGGLKVVRAGGGHQTRSLRLEDKDGRTYNMRGMKKSAVQFLQNVIIKDKIVENEFKNTIPEDLILDFYTAAHPYGAFTIPKLSDAAEVLHTNPKLFYVPKQKALGKFNKSYGDELYMIVERPDKKFDGPLFDYPDNVESTDDLLEKLQRDEKYALNEKAYIRARIFDMLIGDWDRHNDQWRFTQHDNKDGSVTFEPIPRDRDQVYSNFDGGLLDVVRTLFNTSRQFQVYGAELKHTKWFNAAGIKLDRALIQSYGKDEWLAQAEFLNNNVTDQVIDKAFEDLPKEVQDETASEIKEKLKGRRDNIVRIAQEYYDYLAKLQTVVGTNKDDYFEITRLPDGKTNIKTYRIKKGAKADLMLDRTYSADETNEIWIYGLDDDDVFEVKGNGSNPISIKIIGGQNNDVYKIANGRKIKVYDQKSRKNTIENRGGAAFRLTDNYDFNTYDYKKQIQTVNLLLPAAGYNPDDGVKIGLTDVFTVHGFQRNPFSQQHRFAAGYYFGTESFDINYEGEFANVFGKWNFLAGGYFQNPNFSENFFGFGNETINPDYEFDAGKDYNRVRIGGYGVSVGIKKDSPYGSIFQFRTKFYGVKIESTPDRFITDYSPSPIELDKTHYYGTVEGSYQYESYDNKVNPTRGMNFNLEVGGTQNIQDSDRVYGYVNPQLVFYGAITRDRKVVLKTDMRAQFNIGDNYEFFQAAKLGSDSGLRAYRKERFSGQTAAVGSADIRYSFNQFRTALTPIQIGVFGGYDIGRVWVPNDTSNVWHSSYGGGLWINTADLLSATLNLFAGEEGIRFTLGLKVSM